MRTLQQELIYRIEKHTLTEVLDRLADVAKAQDYEDELIKALELAIAVALRIESDVFSNHTE